MRNLTVYECAVSSFHKVGLEISEILIMNLTALYEFDKMKGPQSRLMVPSVR